MFCLNLLGAAAQVTAPWWRRDNLYLLPPGETQLQDLVAITNARCIAFAIWSPTEPAANLHLYQLILISQGALAEGLSPDGTFSR